MPSAKASAPPPPSAMGKTGSLKSRFSFGRSASISLSKASIFSFKSVPAQQPVAAPPPDPVPVAVRVPPARPSEDTVVAIERKPSIVLDSPQTSPVLRTPSSLGRASTRSRVSFDAPFVQRTSPSPHARPSLDLAHLRPRHSPSPSPSPLRQSPSFLRASPSSSAFDLSSLQFSRDEIPVPVGDSSADVSHLNTTGGGDGSFNIDELDPDLALLLQPGGSGTGAAVTSTPARPRKLGVPPVSSQHFFDTSPSPSPSPGPDSFSATGRPRGSSLSTRTRQLQSGHAISRPGTAPPTEEAHAQRNFFARRLGIKRSTSVEDVIQPSPSPVERRAGRASLDYGASPREPPSSSRFGRGSLDYGSPAYTPARPSLDRESPRPSIDTVRASRRAALERSGSERTNLFTTSLRARRGELGSSHSERAAGSEYGWERDERTWRPGEFGEARSEYGGARSEFTGSGSGGARSEYSGARSEFGGARSASEYAGPTAAWRRGSPLSPSPTPTATRSVTSGTSSSTAYLSDELERLRSKHAAETEALLAALGDAQRSARVLREENERLRARVRELEERERERAEEARRVAVAASRERKPALVPRRAPPPAARVGGGHARVASGATTVRASPSPTPSPSPSLAARPAVVRARTSPIPRIVHPPPTIESSFDGDVSLSLSLNLDDADALDAAIRVKPLVPKTPSHQRVGRHVQTASDASASSFAMSIPPEGQSLLRDALPESDAEPEGRSFLPRQPTRSPSHAVLNDSFDDEDDDEVLLDGLEASPTLVLGGARTREKVGTVVAQPREVSMTETEMSGSPTSARSLKLRPEHERLLGMGFESEVDV